METDLIPVPVLDVPVAAFAEWLSKVSLDTLAGERADNLYASSYNHPLAMWLSFQVGAFCGVRLDRANRLLVECRRQDGAVALHTLPSWAAWFYSQTCYSTARLTSGVCLGMLKPVLHLAA